MATWGQLKTLCGSWLARGDLNSNFGDFWTLAELWLNDQLPLRLNRTEIARTGSTGSRSIALPSDYSKPVSLFLTTFGVQTELKFVASGLYPRSVDNGVPRKWGINGSNIELDFPCDQAHTFQFFYIKSETLDQTSDSNTTNMLTAHSDVCLFAMLTEAHAFAQDVASAELWGTRRNNRKDEIWLKESKSLDGELAVDAALRGRGGFSITSGD